MSSSSYIQPGSPALAITLQELDETCDVMRCLLMEQAGGTVGSEGALREEGPPGEVLRSVAWWKGYPGIWQGQAAKRAGA